METVEHGLGGCVKDGFVWALKDDLITQLRGT